MKKILFTLIVALVGASISFASEEFIEVSWESVGIGGGGGIFNPSISPHDPNLIFVSCDMGGFYRSMDGARSWQMLDGYTVRKVNHPAVFHPSDPNMIYVTTRGGIRRSVDKGKTWQHVLGEFDPVNPDFPTAIAIDPGRPEVIWVYFNTYLGQKGHFLVRTEDRGQTWHQHPGWTLSDKPVQQIVFDPTSPLDRRRVFLYAGGDLYRSDDDGESWQLKTSKLPAGDNRRDFTAAWDLKSGTHALYITRPSLRMKGQFHGGVYKSTNGGDSWQQVVKGLETKSYRGKFQQFQLLSLSPYNTQIVYVSSLGPAKKLPFHPTVWRTQDGGNSWEPVLFGDPTWRNSNVDPDWLTTEISWWWGGVAIGLTCNPNDPEDVIFTDPGRAIRTTDGGQRWIPISSHRLFADGDEWVGRGLEVSTSYEYYFDPHDPKRTYITYTDFGMTRSLNRGESWKWAARGSPWANSCYELALDSERPGVAFGAWGQAHDLPHWKMLIKGKKRVSKFKGGITKSTDYCASWKPIGRFSLPRAAATTIVLDSRTPLHSRTLYAGFFDKGVYKSIDDGRTWSPKNKGMESPNNMNVLRMDLHTDGTLLCAKTIAYVDGRPVFGGLYRSINSAEHWEKINQNQPLDYIFGVRMDPRDSNIIYVACFDVPPEGFAALGTNVPWPRSKGGGVFKTTDGGMTWKKILNEPWCWDITFDPNNPDIVYAGTFYGGVYRSVDAGQTWQSLKGLPFICAQRITVDPKDPKTIYVTTFGGGVWKGRLP